MKKLGRILVLFLLCGLLMMLSGAVALGLYYRRHFPVNTWINGVYCTGKTLEEVNAELAEQLSFPDVVIRNGEDEKWTITPAELELRADYMQALRKFLRQNASGFWLENLQNPTHVRLEEVQYRWNEEKLKACFDQLIFVQDEKSKPSHCQIRFDADAGYQFYDGNKNRLDTARALSYIGSCLEEGQMSIDLTAGGCYQDLQDTAEDTAERQLWGKLQEFFAVHSISYDMGTEQLTFTEETLSSFLAMDENGRFLLDKSGKFVIDQEAVEQWVEELAAEYNTAGTVRAFQSTRGDVIDVKYGTYGTELNSGSEVNFLLEMLAKEELPEKVHTPKYRQKGFVRGLDDIGGTYIEVDMTEQHMYYYVDGELVLDTDVVTGCTGKRRGTPEGIYFVYAKQKDRFLRGEDYENHVDYWMPVKGGVGIHDADWRRKFGGELYKKSGSHGCINTPPKVMKELYPLVKIGTPVVMFY